MKFINNRKILFGSLGLVVSLFGINASGAIAQGVKKSERYLSNQEIRSLESDLQSRVSGGSRFFQERRTSAQINKINNFVNAWQKVDPSIAPFLGSWGGFEESLLIYPSKNRGQVCVVLSFFSSSRNMVENVFNIGTVSGNKLLVMGDLGKRLVVKKKGTLRSGNKIDFVAVYGAFDGRKAVGEFLFPRLLQEINDARFTGLGCTASLPF